MKKITKTIVVLFLFLGSITTALAQDKSIKDEDLQIKDNLYTKYKKEVYAYDKKQFDALFFEFFQKQGDSKVTMTKEEYYTYTIKIAIYSEKFGLLYKDQKEEADLTKKEWYDKSYSDYLNLKK